MVVQAVADGARGRKSVIRKRGGLVITDGVIAGLRAMRTYGRITIEQYAAAAGMTYDSARRSVARLDRHDLMSRIRPGAHVGVGRLPDLIGLTKAGHDLLDDDLPFNLPPRSVRWSAIWPHRLATIDALIAAERSVIGRPGWSIERIIPEFRGSFPTADYTAPDGKERLKFDGVLVMRDHGWSSVVAIEADMATMKIRDLAEKFALHWRYLASRRVRKRFGVDDLVFATCLITTSPKRVENIIAGIEWSAFVPLDLDLGQPVLPRHVFWISDRDAAKADFFGAHWRRPGIAGTHALIADGALSDAA